MSQQVQNHPGTNKGEPVRAPGTFTISTRALNPTSTPQNPVVVTSASATHTRKLGSSVPKQVLKMISYRAQFKDAGVAIGLGRVLVDLSFIDNASMIDDLADSPTITLLLDEKAVTLNQNPGKVLMMRDSSGVEVTITVRKSTGEAIDPGDLISLTIEFQRDFIEAP